MSENIKFIVVEVNKLLEKNYNLIGFSALNPEDLLQVIKNTHSYVYTHTHTHTYTYIGWFI